jgi:DHA1 family inner membrane transport protein
VWFALGIGAVGFGGFFAMYSYIAPMVTDVSGSPEWTVSIVLVIIGLGMTAGNLVGGHLADLNLKKWLLIGLLAMAVASALLALTAGWIVTLAAFAAAIAFVGSALSPAIQTRLMDVAGDNQSIAAAMNHSSLNIGNSLGAFLGGAVIAFGWGFTAPAWVGAVLALAGLAVAIASFRVEKNAAVRRSDPVTVG